MGDDGKGRCVQRGAAWVGLGPAYHSNHTQGLLSYSLTGSQLSLEVTQSQSRRKSESAHTAIHSLSLNSTEQNQQIVTAIILCSAQQHSTAAQSPMAQPYTQLPLLCCNITLSWWLHWLSVGLVIERSLVQLPAWALSSQPGQLSLPSLRGR